MDHWWCTPMALCRLETNLSEWSRGSSAQQTLMPQHTRATASELEQLSAAVTAGVLAYFIKLLGRWESEAYHLYIQTRRESLASISQLIAQWRKPHCQQAAYISIPFHSIFIQLFNFEIHNIILHALHVPYVCVTPHHLYISVNVFFFKVGLAGFTSVIDLANLQRLAQEGHSKAAEG